MNSRRMVVFTDLDGTLLDHHSYRWQAAAQALEALRLGRIPLILNSSKTRAEITALRQELGNNDPFIIENGAAVVIPADYFQPGPEQVLTFSSPRSELLEVLTLLRAEGFRFRNFDATSVAELARLTGLSEEAAANARQRTATEPLLWEDTDEALEAFTRALAQRQLQLLKGGRFYHVMGHFDKADAMAHLLAQYRMLYPGETLVSVALGDSPNDLRMLEQADIPVIIKSVNPGELKLAKKPAIYSREPGPAGWNDCILKILADKSAFTEHSE